MKGISQKRFVKAMGVMLMMLSVSCVPLKNLSYFNDIDNLPEPAANPRSQKVIMPFDKLYIKVLSIDPKTNQLFNSSDGLSNSTSINIASNLVDKDGNIVFPFAGVINVGGLTTGEAATRIEKVLNEYVSNATVIVKFIDNNVTLLGEVMRQGMYTFTQDKITIYEALALGGGLSRYGNRRKVILVRQEGDKVVHHKLDLSDSKIADKEYYYVVANDVIVVEPIRSISSSYGNNTASMILSSVSVLISILIFSGLGK